MDSITIKDRKFDFRIPSAWDGCSIFNMLTTYSIPFGASFLVGLKALKNPMGSRELEEFMKLCLQNCYEELAHPTAVVDEQGNIGINDAEAPLLTKIATQYIVFFLNWWRAENDLDSAQSPLPISQSKQ